MAGGGPEGQYEISPDAYPLALEVASVGVWEWDAATDGTVWSSSWPALLGLDVADLPDGMAGAMSLVHPGDRAALIDARDELLAGARRRQLLYRLRHADGSWLKVRGAASVLRDDAGRPERMVLAVVDVTDQERRMAMAELRHGVEEVARRSTAALIGASDGDGEIREVILAGLRDFAELLGADRASLFFGDARTEVAGEHVVWPLAAATAGEGTTLEDAVSSWLQEQHEWGRPVRITALDELVPSSELGTALAAAGLQAMLVLPFTADRIGGALLLGSVQPQAWSDDVDAALRAFAGACVQAHDRRRLTGELAEAHRHLQHLVDRAPLTMWRLSEESDRLSYLSANTSHLLGADASDVQDDWLERVHPDDLAAVERAVAAMRLGGEETFEARFRHEDGQWRTFEIFGRPDPAEAGAPRGAVGYSMDISDRRAAEAQVRRAERLEAIGQLAGGVAHEFNNLLTVMQGYMELAREGDVDAVEEGLRAAETARGLVERLLTFSRQRDVEPVAIDLNEMLRSLQSIIRLVSSGVEVELDLTEPLPLVHADEAQLEQAILNLVSNAREAMDAGGRIALRTDRADPVHVGDDGVEAGGYVRLRIEDTGSGMGPEVERRAFEPFFTTKADVSNPGLGLSVAHGTITAVGGSLRLDSTLGAGTTVHVFLRATAPVRPVGVDQAREPGRAMSVLVVDDQPQIAALVGKLLVRAGYEVRVAADGDEALALADEEMPDLLLTDIAMPTLSGPEVAATLRARDPHLAVLYISGYPDSALPPDQRGLLLRKPFSLQQLDSAVQAALAHR